MKLKIITYLVLISLGFLGGYFTHSLKFPTQKETLNNPYQVKNVQQIKNVAKAKYEYEKALASICSKPLVEATAVELYNCQDFKSSGDLMASYGLSPKTATSSASLPAFCQRKITEMKMLDLVKCLTWRVHF